MYAKRKHLCNFVVMYVLYIVVHIHNIYTYTLLHSVSLHELCSVSMQEEMQVFSYPQVKCVCYWPEKLHDSLTVENKFRVTFSSNMPFAEYEFRKFKLENVSSFPQHSNTLSITLMHTFPLLPISLCLHSKL